MSRSSLVFPLLLVALVFVGCAEKNVGTIPNLPPETYIAIADSVRNPVVYVQRICWWGEDLDGEVVGYEYRCTLDTSETGCGVTEDWVATTEKSMVFNFPVTRGVAIHKVEVRAVDDQGAKDPTPASVTLPLFNSPPSVEFLERGSLPDTTYPAIRLKWRGSDPEGNQTIAGYMLRLDGSNRLIPFGAKDTTGCLGFEDFEGRYGQRTVYLYAIDTGCDTSKPTTYTWYVREPRGRVLLVDNLPKAYGGYKLTDAFYRSAVESVFSEYSILDIERFGGAAYTYAFERLFDMFDIVIWYNDPWYDPTLGRETIYLSEAVPTIVEYVSRGGKFLLASLCAIGTRGAFHDSVAMDFFGIDEPYWYKKNVSDFSCKRWVVKGNRDLGLEEIKVDGNYQGCECFRPKDSATALFWIDAGTMENQMVDYYIGLGNSYGDGKVVLVTFPFSRSNIYGNLKKVFGAVMDYLD